MPVPAYNTFNRTMDRLNGHTLVNQEPIRSETYTHAEFGHYPWPVQPGDYLIFRPQAAIAVLVIGNPTGLAPNNFADQPNVAIAGRLTTENIGIEYIVKNVIANPNLRHLVLIGADIPGHRPGDAVLNLAENGLEDDGRINSACGARPVLKNVLPLEMEHFRRQITVHNLMHLSDGETARRGIADLSLIEADPFEHGLIVQLVEITKAEPAKRLQLDKTGYFIILPRPDHENPLYVEHYRNDGRLAHIIEGPDSATVCATLLEMGLVSQMDHACYLGRELAKAEASLSTDLKYVQDRAQGGDSCS